MKGSTPGSLDSDHTKDLGTTPLDEGIADTFVSASHREGLQRGTRASDQFDHLPEERLPAGGYSQIAHASLD